MAEAQSEINVRAPSYYIARTVAPCSQCNARTEVFALALPRTHETFEPNWDAVSPELAIESWDCPGYTAMLSDIIYLPAGVATVVGPLAGRFRTEPEDQAAGWCNHCERCGARVPDFDLFEEFDTPFSPVYPAGAAAIDLIEITEPFAANAAGYHYGSLDFGLMRLSSL